MAAAEDWARGRGLDVLELDVATPNEGGGGCTSACGYVRVAESMVKPCATADGPFSRVRGTARLEQVGEALSARRVEPSVRVDAGRWRGAVMRAESTGTRWAL